MSRGLSAVYLMLRPGQGQGRKGVGLDFKPLGEELVAGQKRGRFMKNQITWVDITVTNLGRAITRYSAVSGGQAKKQENSAQDFVFGLFPHAYTHVASCRYQP